MEESKWDGELIEKLTGVMHDTFVRESNNVLEVEHPFKWMPEGRLKEAHRKACMAVLDKYLELKH